MLEGMYRHIGPISLVSAFRISDLSLQWIQAKGFVFNVHFPLFHFVFFLDSIGFFLTHCVTASIFFTFSIYPALECKRVCS